nr:hypothetical protein FRC0402_01893 [Corynebacterium diphtheriae]
METSHQPTSRGLPRPIRGLLVNQAPPRTQTIGHSPNLSSIAIQIGSFGALCPERRSEVASLGMKALFAGFCTNMLNAAIVGVVAF